MAFTSILGVIVGCVASRRRGCLCLVLSAKMSSWLETTGGVRPRVRLRQGSIAFGPQHPAAHGILRIQLQLGGEVVRWLDPQFGFLHRGTEKLMEGRTTLQSLPYFDRFDYVANLFQEHAFCLAIEALAQKSAYMAVVTQLGRLIFDEISRVLNHLLTLSATSLDLGVMGPIF
jgi:NADH-quinone oxidoreductase subunit D